MLSAVDCDPEPQTRAIEIQRERADWMLPPEMEAIQLIAAQRMPETRFGIGHAAAKILRACRHRTRTRET
jgi:hypothetical protein